MPATGLMFHRLLRAILEQKVTGKEAHRAYRVIVRHFAEPAPGPAALTLPPDPAAVAATPYWTFHPFGVEQRRTQALQRAALVADRLEQCADTAEATRRLVAIPGHRRVDGGRGGPHHVRRRGRGERRRLPHPEHGGLGAGR